MKEWFNRRNTKCFDSSYKRKRDKKIGKRKDETNENDDTEDLGSTEDENEDGQNSNTHYDQDSDISFENGIDDEIDTTAIEEEECIDYIERSTDEAVEKMENKKIRCWIKTHKRMKWRLALRIALLPSERCIVKAAEWNPELSSRNKIYRTIGKPKRRWEDDINEFLKFEVNETEKLYWKWQQIQQIMDQNSKRQWKMDSSWKRWHNDCRRQIRQKCETQKVFSKPTSKIR